jgi:hypothetical protein
MKSPNTQVLNLVRIHVFSLWFGFYGVFLSSRKEKFAKTALFTDMNLESGQVFLVSIGDVPEKLEIVGKSAPFSSIFHKFLLQIGFNRGKLNHSATEPT